MPGAVAHLDGNGAVPPSEQSAALREQRLVQGLGAWAYARGVRRSQAAFGSVLFLVVAPGVVAGHGRPLVAPLPSRRAARSVARLPKLPQPSIDKAIHRIAEAAAAR
jgi:hypothetical protein